ncbi:HD domain-containing phosphohydrolase [Clostridium sp. UBA4548]|uniref:HD domain-containing phosphohydrolase n=1 Tax=Clostridium sp. UBA4548 TaxID=1946361 RepID=UPI0025B7D938|nr:HD domain-containing phosphohydrolase [Clostridium sp. UBA4548]
MNVRNKVTLILITTTVFIVLFSRFSLKEFFSNYLEKQEEIQVNSIRWNIEAFLKEKMDKYSGVLNDWAHWDDTYEYMKNKYPTFTEENLNDDTFINLEVNFVIIAEKDDLIKTKKYYNFNKKAFEDFPISIDKEIDKIMIMSKTKEDTSAIMKLGDKFYFITSSEITDSMKIKESVGRMIFGRLIDEEMVKTLEKITDSKISFSTMNIDDEYLVKGKIKEDVDSQSLALIESQKYRDFMDMEFMLQSDFHGNSPIIIKLNMDRTLFSGGMKQIHKFILSYIEIMLLISGIVFSLLGRYISMPFTKLIDEVKVIELGKGEVKKLKVSGKDEFAFLRSSINNMLSRIEAEQYKVRENREKLYATLTSVGDGVIAVDKDRNVTFINPVAEELTGWCNEDAMGHNLETIFKVIYGITREKVKIPSQEGTEEECATDLDNNKILISKNGYERVVENTLSPIKDKSGSTIGMVLVFRDCSEKNEKRKEVEFLSYHDQLTGLYNRRYFEKDLKRLNTKETLPLSIIFADVNGLKTINDAFGHKYGDMLLQQVAEVLKKEFRQGDTICRTGGDEFIILLPKAEKALAQKLINQAKEKLEEKAVMNIIITVSFGCDTKMYENEDMWKVVKNAEDFMYQKKIFYSSSRRSEVIKSILNTLHLKTPREDAHSKRVSVICEAMGKAYNLTNDEIKELRLAGELHDIGKIAVDEVILDKPDKLSQEEWEQIRRHPETGYRLLATSSRYYDIAEYVLAHHERWDGTGYPRGLRGEEIPWKARIISIADSFDAMTCERPYRKSFTEEEAVIEIKNSAGKQFDPEIARVFVEKVLGNTW